MDRLHRMAIEKLIREGNLRVSTAGGSDLCSGMGRGDPWRSASPPGQPSGASLSIPSSDSAKPNRCPDALPKLVEDDDAPLDQRPPVVDRHHALRTATEEPHTLYSPNSRLIWKWLIGWCLYNTRALSDRADRAPCRSEGQ